MVKTTDEVWLDLLVERLTAVVAEEGLEPGLALHGVITVAVFSWLASLGYEADICDGQCGAEAIVTLVGDVRASLDAGTRKLIFERRLPHPSAATSSQSP
jgi:hypothetical protein